MVHAEAVSPAMAIAHHHGWIKIAMVQRQVMSQYALEGSGG